MQIVKAPGLPEMNIVRAGPRGGAPVVLLHPLGFDLTWWGAQFDLLSRNHDVVALDLPGHGFSAYPDGPPNFEKMAEAVAAVVDHLDAGPVQLVGISVGGAIAQVLALQRPELVGSLLLVATFCTFPEAARESIRERGRVTRAHGMEHIAVLSNERWFPAEFRERRPDMFDRVRHTLVRQKPAYHADLWDMVAGFDLVDRLPRVACRTLVVVGGADPSTPLAFGQKIADLIPGATLELMPGLGHFPPFQAPERFNPVMTSFIEAA